VANCSWDSGNIQGLGAAVDLAIDTLDVVMAASAGNEGSNTSFIQYLAMRPDVLGVAGILESGTKASNSNYGHWVDMAAFYSGMPTTWYDSFNLESSYWVNPFGGTSFSAPQVAGLAALLRAVDPSASATEIRNVITTTGRDLSDTEPVFADSLGGGLADYAAAAQALGGGWDTVLTARGLTANWDPGTVALLGDSATQVLQVEDGSSSVAVSVGDPLVPGFLPLTANWGSFGSILAWGDGTELWALDSPPDWPVALPLNANQPVAATPIPGTADHIYVPHRDDVLVLWEAGGGGLQSTGLGVPVDILAVGEVDADTVRVLAGMDSLGLLVVWSDSPSGSSPPVSIDLGGLAVPPVIGEFDGPGLAEAVAVSPDSLQPGLRQNVHFVKRDGSISLSVGLDASPIKSLSLAGFASGLRVEAVMSDSTGGIYLVDKAGTVRSVNAGGALAGEVLCADLDGDYESDLVALRADGTLFAWTSNLDPLDGFPRRFPDGMVETPLIVDGGGRRYVVAADTAGGLWSLPVGPADRPSPWPTARGTSGRSGFLGYAQATPVQGPEVVLRWRWEGDNAGVLCWEALGLDDILRLRARVGTFVFWEGPAAETGCASLPGAREGDTILVEGRDRRGSWQTLRAIRLTAPARFTLGIPYPNPFRSDASITWSGAGGGEVKVQIFDVRGRLIIEESVAARAGMFTWGGWDRMGRPVPPGVYFFRLDDGRDARVRRVFRVQ
jgi:hypothetical protein